MRQEIESKYGHQVRVRACGVLIENDRILMVKHMGLGKSGYLWIPPGGGVEVGDSLERTVVREFKEETGLTVEVKKFLFVNEFVRAPLHALEFFFEVHLISGSITLGTDPETEAHHQIISDVRFLTNDQLSQEGGDKVHSRFNSLPSLKAIFHTKSFFSYKNIA